VLSMNVPREPILKSEKSGQIFIPRVLRTDRSELRTSMRYHWHGSAKLELNPPFQNPGSATVMV